MIQGKNINGTGKMVASVALAILVGSLWWLSLPGDTLANVAAASEIPAPSGVEEEDPNQPVDYSKFRHGNQYHSRLPCLVCHVRNDNSTRVGFPGRNNHLPCAGCHNLQFSDPSSPICAICHTNSQTGAMKSFPGLRSFGAKFNHARHASLNCARCHTPSARGVAKDIPSGPSAHRTCFQCHTANSSNAMASCSTCHPSGRLVRVPESARSFRNFSHARHAGDMNCRSCHTVRPGTARGRQVSAPLGSMHFAPARALSCATCHNGKRAFGADDFSNCKRCHTGARFP